MFCILASISLHKSFILFAFSSNHNHNHNHNYGLASLVHLYFVVDSSLPSNKHSDWFYCTSCFLKLFQCAFKCFKLLGLGPNLHVASFQVSHTNFQSWCSFSPACHLNHLVHLFPCFCCALSTLLFFLKKYIKHFKLKQRKGLNLKKLCLKQDPKSSVLVFISLKRYEHQN